MKLLLRLWHELETFRSWLLEGEPHIDGHLWRDTKVFKDGNKYRVESECIECGKKDNKGWMDEMTYLRMKDQLPKLTTKRR